MFDRKCKILFIRHGATIYSEQDRLYDLDDYPPLNQNGRNEIGVLAQWLRSTNQSIDEIYSSSSLRAVQSARILSKMYKKDFTIVEGLHERKAGIWGGLTFSQIEKKYPEMLRMYHKDPSSFWPEGGESTIELQSRVKEVLSGIVKDNIGKSVLILTHAGVVQSAVSMALSCPPQYNGRIYTPTGSATQINYYSEWSSLVFSAYKPV